jgi:hypothetical protein
MRVEEYPADNGTYGMRKTKDMEINLRIRSIPAKKEEA